MRCNSVLASLVLTGVCMGAPIPSPYDHGGAEVDPEKALTIVPGKSPIKTKEYFLGERELLGYAPRFMPTSAVAFDRSNRPYIRASDPGGTPGDGTRDGFIQTLGDDGRWLAYAIKQELQGKYPGWEGTYATGVRVGETRVVFDGFGDAYTLVRTLKPASKQVLLRLREGADAWEVHEIPVPGALRLEPADNYGPVSRPPVVLRESRGVVSLYDIVRSEDGTLTIPPPVTVSPDASFLHPYHSGAGYSSARVGDVTYIVYGRSVPEKGDDGEDRPGAPQYVVAYNHLAGELSQPCLVGFGHNCYTEKPDVHNGSAIVADSEGFLHVIIGAHQHNFWHVRSKTTAPATSADWTEPVPLGLRRRYDCGLTYVALAIDSKDALHVIGRNMSRGTDNEGNALPPDEMNMQRMTRTLDYLRATKQADGSWKWEELGPLLVPFHRAYSIFYHKLTLDRHDRLFLTYYYYADQLSEEAKAAYRARWPEEFTRELPEDAKFPVRAHDPVIIMSDDGGDTWQIATTEDFMAGMVRE